MTFSQFVYQFGSLINAVIAALAAVAVFIFFLGLLRYMFIISQGETRAGAQARDFMVWGIIALFVIVSLGGILNFFANDFFGTTVSNGGTTPSYPGTNNAVQSSDCTYDSGSGKYSCNGFQQSGGIQTNGPSGAFQF